MKQAASGDNGDFMFTSLEWKLSGDIEGVSNFKISVNVNDKTSSSNETSGIITINSNNVNEIIFSYTYNGVTYEWSFSNTYNNGINWNNLGWNEPIVTGTSKDVTLYVNSTQWIYGLEGGGECDIESITLLAGNPEVVSFEPKIFTADDINDGTLSFTLKALKAGQTTITALAKYNSEEHPFDSYYSNYIPVKEWILISRTHKLFAA